MVEITSPIYKKPSWVLSEEELFESYYRKLLWHLGLAIEDCKQEIWFPCEVKHQTIIIDQLKKLGYNCSETTGTKIKICWNH